MAPALDAAVGAPHHHGRQIRRIVLVGVGHPGAIEDHHVVEQRAIAILGSRKLRDKAGEQFYVIPVDLLYFSDQGRVALVMRDWMMRIGDPDLAKSALAAFAADHEGADPREVRLISN